MRVCTDIEYVPREDVDAGITLLADALLLLTTDTTVDAALCVAQQLAQTTFQRHARQRALERHASELRAQLDSVEQQLRNAA
jgi:hypothetical protein